MSALTGAAPLLRAELRHNGRLFAPWIVIVTVIAASSPLVYPWVFPDQADRMALSAAISGNPALGLIFGPAYDLTTDDGFTEWRGLALGGFLAALGAILAVTRATRAQEDSGQAELLASGVMGRGTRLLSGVAVAFIGSLLLGTAAAAATWLCGASAEASWLLGAGFTATGWLFAAAAAVCAQLGSEARAANSIAVGALGVLFIARGFLYTVDVPDWIRWLDPLSWTTETHPGTDPRWWPLLLCLGLAVVLLAVAFALQARRDFGSGMIASRPGPAHGRIRSAWSLQLRIHRGPILTWLTAFVCLGVVFGFLTTSIQDILSGDSAVQQILAAGATSHEALISAFLVTILSLVGILAAVPGVQIMLKLRAEELADQVEPLLATRLSRPRLFASALGLALLLPAVCMLIAGTEIAALAAAADIGAEFGDTLLQALATVPAIWTAVSLSAAVVGARPQVLLAAWIGVLASFGLTLLGPTFKLWDSIMAISPFWHIPDVTASDPDWLGLVWISLVTVVLIVIGFAGFRRRDIARQ